jgi:cysteine desulfurase
MKRIYLDNAATTPMDPIVIAEMTTVMQENYGNPSASHCVGRNAKGILETARRDVAKRINAEPREIIFTSGGTEADNMAVRCAVRDLGVKNILTTPIEHKAVLQTSQELEALGHCKVHFIDLDGLGRISYDHLAELAEKYPHSLISVMHANNEIGTCVDLKRIGSIARANKCYFHSDTVQTIGHLPVDVREMEIDFLTCSAHKLHGPKGSGFLFSNKNLPLKALITGGGQERSQRAGTENVVGIAGLSKSLELACTNMEHEHRQIRNLKDLMMKRLQEEIEHIEFNGDTSDEGSLFTVLSALLPPTEFNSLILFKLDIQGVCCSGGSACNSGTSAGSHVMNALNTDSTRQAIRFSFGRFTTVEDIEGAVKALVDVLKPSVLESI